MAVKIPFVREMTFEYGVPQQVSPLIRRIVANNPGSFTYMGTGVYVIGRGEVAVIDPGPDERTHVDGLIAALAGETVTHIFVTHGHMDHSPAARPLAEATGAKIYACGEPVIPTDSEVRMEAGDDLSFRPDVEIEDGEIFRGKGWTIEAVSTPGHTSHHMAYALKEENALFPGDHIMGWSTTVISPPDGDMNDYFESLVKVRDRNYYALWPTHGPPITQDVRGFVQAYLDHRVAREGQIVEQLRQGRNTIRAMVPVMYAEVDKKLHPAACHSVLAHMVRLVKIGRVECIGAPCIDSIYALAKAS